MVIEIIVYRGVFVVCLENIMVVFEYGLQFGVMGIEIDVQMFSDGRLVLIYDEILNWIVGVFGWVKDIIYE